MSAMSRIVMTSLTLALAVPLLSAAFGCNDCEDLCQQQYDECNSGGATTDPLQCRSELNRCLGSCDSEPSGWDRWSE